MVMFAFTLLGILSLLLILTIKEFVIPKIKPRIKLYILAKKNRRMQKTFTKNMKELEIK